VARPSRSKAGELSPGLRPSPTRLRLDSAFPFETQADKLFRAVLEASPDDITTADLDGRIKIASPAAVKMFGYEREEQILGRSVFDGLAAEEWSRARSKLAALVDGSAASLGEYVAMRRDESRFFIEVNTAVVRDEKGAPVGYLFIVRDVTRRKKLELELQQHREQLEALVVKRTAEIKRSNDALHDMNAALKVLLAQREEDRRQLEQRVVQNIEHLVRKFVDRLRRTSLDDHQRAYVDVIDAHLTDICSPLMTHLGDFQLTPREIQVAALVRAGNTSKNIAEVLNIAVASVSVHRKNIRAKLKLRGAPTNLQVQLGRLASNPEDPSVKNRLPRRTGATGTPVRRKSP